MLVLTRAARPMSLDMADGDGDLAALLGRLDSVYHQVREHLLDLHHVDVRGARAVLGFLYSQSHVMLLRERGEQIERAPREIADVDRHFLRRFAAGEVEEPTNDPRHALGLRDDRLRV